MYVAGCQFWPLNRKESVCAAAGVSRLTGAPSFRDSAPLSYSNTTLIRPHRVHCFKRCRKSLLRKCFLRF